MRRIPAFAQSEVFLDFLREEKIIRDKIREHAQEDAGYYLMKLIGEKRWVTKLWNRECGVRFMESRKKNDEEEPGRWRCRRGVKREPLIVVSTDGTRPLCQCVKESLLTNTSEITIVKRVQHPAPRYLVLNFATKVGKSTPLRYFQRVDFSEIVSYEAVGYVVHLGSDYHGHYIYITNTGEIFDDLTTEERVISPDKINFEGIVSPTLVLYRRVTRRRNSMSRMMTITKNTTAKKPFPGHLINVP
jgi:hypothetical protein